MGKVHSLGPASQDAEEEGPHFEERGLSGLLGEEAVTVISRG